MTTYEELFERNYGVFDEEEQQRLKAAKILVVGCGGVGGAVACALARSGVGKFVLVDFDAYEPSNMNRQMGCFADTLGRNKAEVTAEQILAINPEAEVEAHPEYLPLSEIARLMEGADLVFPAADDFAFSIMVFRQARRNRLPALLVFPSGTWANVTIIGPEGPTVEDVEGVPPLPTYEELSAMLNTPKYRLGTYYYVPLGNWKMDYYRSYLSGEAPLAQIAPVVWTAASLGALEAVKLLSGRWKPVSTPHYWTITAEGIKKNRVNAPSVQTLLAWQRRLGYALFQGPLGRAMEKAQDLWFSRFQKRMTAREKKRRAAKKPQRPPRLPF
ncbi:MAG: ThiF family adenylyltransferase [Deltaproteobacteria bacterium]|nr:ThiF family adenylyltransferase [Deltaproteobacteria bacterium]